MTYFDEANKAMKLAERAMAQTETIKASALETMKMTIQLGEHSRGKLDEAILLMGGGDNLKALLVIGELRIKFDRFVKSQHANILAYESKEQISK